MISIDAEYETSRDLFAVKLYRTFIIMCGGECRLFRWCFPVIRCRVVLRILIFRFFLYCGIVMMKDLMI